MRRLPLRLRHQPLALAALLALGSLPGDPAFAVNCTWNPATGNWSTAGNWSCGLVPGGADTATIAVAKTVTVNAVQSILNLNNAGGIDIELLQLNLVGGGGTINTGVINVGAGPSPNNATLQVAAGHSIDNTGGVINVSADSVINQFGSTITGGTINTTGSGKLVAFNSGANVLSGVTLGGTLDLAGGTGIERIFGGLTLNNATIQIGANSILAPQGNQTISGTGSIVFADANGSNRLNVEAGSLTLGSGITVHGGNGVIGQQAFAGGAATLTNNGTISADEAGRSITIAVSGDLNNNGTLSALNGGTLNIHNNVVGGAGSQIIAGAGSVVNQNGVTLSGAMNIVGSGSFRPNNSGNNMLAGVSLAGTLDLASATGIERVSGGLTFVNNATINIGSNSILAPQGNQTFAGSGEIVFADANGNNRLNVEAGTLTLASGITVRGGNGLIGQQAFAGGAAALVNHGTIQADVAGRGINLGVNGLTTNHGTLAALNGGTLNLNSAVDGVSGSQIVAGVGSVVNQNGVTLSGAMNLTGAGSFRPNNSGNNFLSGVTLSGTLDLASATGIERVSGGMALSGATVNIGANSVFAPQGNQTISGNGSFVFADSNGNNRFNVEAGTLTLASGVTIHGGNGIIGNQNFLGGAASLINQGQISADVNARTIHVSVSGSTVNQNLMSAANGGTLQFNSSVDNSAGTLRAGAGSLVFFNGVSVSGGLLESTGDGVFGASSSGNNFLNGVTLGGVLDMSGALGQGQVRITSGGMVLNGRIDIGANSVLAPQGAQTISGSGSINFVDGNGNNRFNIEAGTTTIGSGVTVRGGNGIIGQQAHVGGAATLVNQGLVSADVAGRSIQVGPTAGTVNQNLMQATGGGLLQFNTGVDNNAGTLRAEAGSVVFFNGVTVAGGQLASLGSGVFRASSSGNNFLNGVTLDGVLDLTGAQGQVRLSDGGMVLNGRIDIGANSVIAPQGAQTISGSGVINFADGSGSNRLNVEAGTLTLGSGITLHGITGVIGQQAHVGGAATLINQGTINSDGGGTITINVASSTINHGTMRAQNGTLTIFDNLSGTGTLQADPTGVINLANGGNTQGRLLMGAAGSAIAIGNGNLTINTDYTNTGAGSGNSFNRRAGVSGAGQIVAGGNVAQVITGSGVSNGATTNATLTIGNLRVGANTFNIQIGNAGSTGPTLRGAIQTAANGGNISDARLSGSGVTAANYNAGAPGGNSGDLAVVFTAASAGALSPLAGQVINLRSNFENIADQKLNIVLGGGAAAYNAAVGAATPSPAVVVANQRVGGSNSTALSVTNTAPGGLFSEDLRATFGANTGTATNNGGIVSALVAQGTDAASMRVGVDTSSAGAKSGTVTLNYQTTGTVNGVSNGLPLAGANAPQVIDVSGKVFLAAQPSPSSLPAVVNLGNFRAGSGPQNAAPIVLANTNLAPAGFQEGLTASIVSTSGSATGTGFINAAAGSSGSLTLGLSGIAAGNNTGTVGVQLRSSGITTSGDTGLGTLNLGGVQNVTVNGTGWRLAQPNAIGPIDFGNVLKDTLQTRTVSISNLAATDGFSEALNAAFGTIGGADPLRFSTSGAINGLLAGTSDNATMVVTLNTSSTGAVSANVQILLTSNGTAVGNGLGLNPLQTQVINLDGVINANVGNLAQASLSPTNVNFGKFREGAPNQTQQLTIGNNVAGPAEGLNASFGAVSGGASHNGVGITSLAPGGSNTSMSVTLGGLATAGAKNGSVTVNFASDGSFNNGTPTNLPSQVVNLAAEVYRLAQATVTPNLTLAARRVGDAGSSAVLTVANTAAADGFSEGLRGTLGAAPAGFAVSGPAATGLIAAGANATRTVTLNTGAAGVFSGNIGVALLSDGAGTSGFGEFGLAGANTAVSGKVYAPAVGQLATPVIDFGVVRVTSGPLQRLVTVNNIAPGSALDDTLRANLSGIGGPFTSGGTVGGIAAGGNGTIAVTLTPGGAGIHNQTGTLAFLSQNPDMSDASAGANAALTVLAQINNLANADFDKLSGLGLLTQNGSDYVLDLGTLLIGDNVASFLRLDNDVPGPADDLSGSFDLSGADDFVLAGWNPFANLAAGGVVNGLNISFVASATGLFEDRIVFNGVGTNASDPQGLTQSRQLIIRAQVSDGGGNVPEPGSLALLLVAAAGALVARRRRVH